MRVAHEWLLVLGLPSCRSSPGTCRQSVPKSAWSRSIRSPCALS